MSLNNNHWTKESGNQTKLTVLYIITTGIKNQKITQQQQQ